MVKNSLSGLPEVFVSDTSISRAVSAAVARGELRKLASRLYTRNLDEAPERLVRRNWHQLLAAYYPDALIADRTAIENQPAEDGSVFLISSKLREIKLPGLSFRPRKGHAPLESDTQFVGVRLSSTARAWLENMRPSRSIKGRISRTLSPEERETRLDNLLRLQGEEALNRIRDQARQLAPQLGLENEAQELSNLIGTLLGTRDAALAAPQAIARAAGQPFDPNRIELFETLFAALRDHVPVERPVGQRRADENANLSFFEAYFSNFIEGTRFTVDEAVDIVFEGKISPERPADSHDIIGTFRVVSDQAEMSRVPQNFEEFLQSLRTRHAAFMAERPEARPGQFKDRPNQVGGREFVLPDLVQGTLQRGYQFLEGLEPPFCRAVFMMFLVTEVHPFTDGNGRAARMMTNAQFAIGNQERIIIPIVYRDNYLSALRALTLNGETRPLIRMMDYAQLYTHSIDWLELAQARATLDRTNAFADPNDANLRMPDQAA